MRCSRAIATTAHVQLRAAARRSVDVGARSGALRPPRDRDDPRGVGVEFLGRPREVAAHRVGAASAELAVELDLPPRVAECRRPCRGPTRRRRPSGPRRCRGRRAQRRARAGTRRRARAARRRRATDACARARTSGSAPGPRTPRPCRDAAGERGLARAERAGEHDEVAGAQHPADAARRAPPCRRATAISCRPIEGVEAAHADTCRRGTRGPMRVTIS